MFYWCIYLFTYLAQKCCILLICILICIWINAYEKKGILVFYSGIISGRKVKTVSTINTTLEIHLLSTLYMKCLYNFKMFEHTYKTVRLCFQRINARKISLEHFRAMANILIKSLILGLVVR